MFEVFLKENVRTNIIQVFFQKIVATEKFYHYTILLNTATAQLWCGMVAQLMGHCIL